SRSHPRGSVKETISPAQRTAPQNPSDVPAGRQHGRGSAGRRVNPSRGSRSTTPHPAPPRRRELREGPYERSGRGALETTGTRPRRAAESSARRRASEESHGAVATQRPLVTREDAVSSLKPRSRSRPPPAR